MWQCRPPAYLKDLPTIAVIPHTVGICDIKMATTTPSTAPSANHLPLLSSTAEPQLNAPPPFSPDPPPYHAPPLPSHRNVRFQSPPADPPRDAPDNHSLLPPYTLRKEQYKGYKSEEDYLAALKAWAEDKALMQPGEKNGLEGFYGRETMQECIAKNPRLRERKEKRGEGEGRRKSFGAWLGRKKTG